MKSGAVPTLEDVANEAGVSTATVSRCLNSPDRVVEATRTRVLNVVERLGYSPNFGARALAAKRTNTIGAIIPTMENAIFARGIQAFQEELRRLGVTLLVASSSYRPDVEADQVRTLTARGADGLLLIGHHRSEDIYQFLERRNVPVLAAWVYDPHTAQLSVGFDNTAAMQDLVQHIISRGHREIGAISAPLDSNDRARGRVDGIKRAMAQNGLDTSRLNLIEAPYGVESGAEAMTKLMASSPRPSVVVCGNDVLAVGAMKQAKAMGLSVPDDVSVTGFDDIELARLVDPELTTVHVPHREMGKQAARMLVTMVNGETVTQSIKLETSVQLRGSLAPPKTV